MTTRIGARLTRQEVLTGHRAAMAWVGLVLGVLAVPAAAVPALGVPVRFAILLAFVCCAPGAAFVCLIRLGDRVSSWAMAFVLSLALAGGLADVMLWTDQWHPIGGYAVLAAPTLATAVLALLPAWRRVATSVKAGQPPPVGAGPPPDATTHRPRVDRPLIASSLDGTARLPKLADGPALGETIMLPMNPRISDATPLTPALSGGPRPDETGVIRLPPPRPSPPRRRHRACHHRTRS